MAKEKNNAICAICGNPYYMCLSCKDQMQLNPWKVHTDTSEHYKIFQILRGYTIGVYSREEAKEKLGNVDLSDLEKFRPKIKSTIEFILTGKESKAIGSDADKADSIAVGKQHKENKEAEPKTKAKAK